TVYPWRVFRAWSDEGPRRRWAGPSSSARTPWFATVRRVLATEPAFTTGRATLWWLLAEPLLHLRDGCCAGLPATTPPPGHQHVHQRLDHQRERCTGGVQQLVGERLGHRWDHQGDICVRHQRR